MDQFEEFLQSTKGQTQAPTSQPQQQPQPSAIDNAVSSLKGAFNGGDRVASQSLNDLVAGNNAPQKTQPQSDTGFEAFLASAKQTQLQQAQANVIGNQGVNPDTAGQAAQVSRQIGTTQSAVESDLPRYQAQATAQQNAQTLTSAPKTAAFIAQNPDAAKIAQADIQGMSKVENHWSYLDTIKNGLLSVVSSAGKSINLAAGSIPTLADAFVQQTANQEAQRLGMKPIQATDASDIWFKHSVDPIAEHEGEMAVDPNAPFAIKAVDATTKLVGNLALIAATGGTSIEAGAAKVAGEAAPSLIAKIGAGAAHGTKAMAFPAIADAVNTANDVYGQTGDAKQAAAAGAMAYATTTAGGVIPIGMPGRLATRAVTGAVSGMATGELSRLAMNTVLPQQQDFSGENLAISGLTGALLGGIMGRSPVKDGIQKGMQDAVNANAAEAGGQAVEQLTELAMNSKLKQYDPDAFKEFVRSVTEDSAMPNVYVDGKVLQDAFSQSKVDPNSIPGLSEKMGEALQTGGDVRIPVEDYATHIAGTDVDQKILPELKATEGGMTYAEGQKFYQDTSATMQKHAEQMAENQGKINDTEKQVQSIRDLLTNQMQATGRFPADVARASVEPMAQFYKTMAERVGMTPIELHEQYPVHIASENLGGDYLEQKARPDIHLSTDPVNRSKASQDVLDMVHPPGENDKSLRAIIDGKEVGHLDLAVHADGKTADVREVRIDPEFQRQGIASSLYDAAKAHGFDVQNSPFQTDEGKAFTDAYKAKRLPANEASEATPEEIKEMEAQGFKFGQGERGFYAPDTRTIGLLKTADLSTFLHESGHFFLDTLGKLASRDDAPDEIKNDMETALKQMGLKGSGMEPVKPGFVRMYHGGGDYKGGERWLTPDIKYAEGYAKKDSRTDGKVFYVDIPETNDHLVKAFDDEGLSYKAPYIHFNAPEEIAKNLREVSDGQQSALEKWNGMSLEQQRDMHEKFAQSFEQYLMDGKAPTRELQSVFSRFRSWLLNVYQSLQGKLQELTPEVRGVMDRMLASDDAIKATEQARGYFPLDLTQAGATEEQQKSYKAIGDAATQEAISDLTARSLKDLKYSQNAKSKALRELQREAAGERRKIKDEVTNEVMNQPHERAREFMKTGKMLDENGKEQPKSGQLGDVNTKMDKDALKEMYPEGRLGNPDLEKLRGLTAKDGMHPDLIAEMFGINSGHEMIRRLTEEPPAKETIDSLTDQRMLQEHGELTDPKAMSDAADEAVHNAVRAKFMATGLKLLIKSPIPARELERAAREAAQATIAGKQIKDLNPRQYEVAETKSNKEALKQAIKDIGAAIKAQREALLSNQLAKASHEAVAQVKKILAGQAKYDKESVRKKLDPDILDQIDSLRDRFDFRKNPTEGPTKQQVSLQTWAESQVTSGYTPLFNADMMDPTVKMPYKEMTVEQLKGFNDTIRSLETIARERKSVMVDGKREDVAKVVKDLTAKMEQRGKQFSVKDLVQPPRPGVDSAFSVALDRTKSFLRSATAELKGQQFKANAYDTHEILGPFSRAIFNRVFDANYRKVDMLKSLSDEFRSAGERLGKDWQKGLDTLVPNDRLLDHELTEEAGSPVMRELTRGDMLGIARHVGNESNFDKLVNGMEWKPQDVWRFLHQNMTAKDWEATQATWDAFEKHWPDMVEMNKRLGNTSPEQIEPRPFITQFSMLKGGYAPIDYDPLRSRLAIRKADSAAIDPSEGLFAKGYFRADTTTNGSLNSRAANYYDRLNLDFHSIERRLHDTVHDLAYREALIDVHKIIANKDFRKQFNLTYGPEQYKSMQDWVGEIANGQNRDNQLSKLGAILQSSRRMIVANGIALRISTVLKHGGSAGLKSIGYFSGGGEKYFASRMAAIATNHSAEVEGAMKKFPEIRARLMQQDRDYRQTAASMFQGESLHARAERFGHSMVAWSDMMTAVPTAWAAYDRAITDGIPVNRGGTGKPMSEADAIQYANQIVREAHGSNIESSRSMIMQSNQEAVKMLTTLYGFMNNTLGQHLDMADKLRTGGFSRPEVLSRYMMAMIVPALWAGALAEHGKVESWWKWAAGAITGEYAGMVPMLREAFSAAKGYNSAGLPPYMSVLGSVAKPVKDVVNVVEGKEVKSPIKDLGNAIGLAIPGAGQVGTSLQYLADVHSGKEQPKGAIDVARGVALGQSNKKE